MLVVFLKKSCGTKSENLFAKFENLRKNRISKVTKKSVKILRKFLYRYTAHHAEYLKDHADYGFDVTFNGFNWKKIKDSRDNYIDRLHGIYNTNIEKDKITLLVCENSEKILIILIFYIKISKNKVVIYIL